MPSLRYADKEPVEECDQDAPEPEPPLVVTAQDELREYFRDLGRRIVSCDNCGLPCEEPHGDPDKAEFCCLCVAKSAPKNWPICDTCRNRQKTE